MEYSVHIRSNDSVIFTDIQYLLEHVIHLRKQLCLIPVNHKNRISYDLMKSTTDRIRINQYSTKFRNLNRIDNCTLRKSYHILKQGLSRLLSVKILRNQSTIRSKHSYVHIVISPLQVFNSKDTLRAHPSGQTLLSVILYLKRISTQADLNGYSVFVFCHI